MTLTVDNPPMSTSRSCLLIPQDHADKPDKITPAMLLGKLGFNYSVALEFFNPFEDMLQDKKATPLEAGMIPAKLNTIRHCERGPA